MTFLSGIYSGPPPRAAPRAREVFTPRAPRAVSDRHKGLRFDIVRVAIQGLVDRAPVLQLLDRIDPAFHVRVLVPVTAGDLTQRDQAGAEVVRDRERVPDQVAAVVADDVVVQDLEPVLDAGLRPLERGLLGVVRLALVVREELRETEPITEVPVEVTVEPVHRLVHLGAL